MSKWKNFFLPYLYALYSGILFLASTSSFLIVFWCQSSYFYFTRAHSLSFNGPFSKKLALGITSAPFEDANRKFVNTLFYSLNSMSPLASIYAIRFPQIVAAFKNLCILYWSIADEQCWDTFRWIAKRLSPSCMCIHSSLNSPSQAATSCLDSVLLKEWLSK